MIILNYDLQISNYRNLNLFGIHKQALAQSNSMCILGMFNV